MARAAGARAHQPARGRRRRLPRRTGLAQGGRRPVRRPRSRLRANATRLSLLARQPLPTHVRVGYAFFFQTTMRSLNDHRAALTVGTMCVIRREALQRAGGWAEWCLTEDSELAIRIHALGYTSVYMTEVFGRDLIPETFDGYKKQRFRFRRRVARGGREHRRRVRHPRRRRSPGAGPGRRRDVRAQGAPRRSRVPLIFSDGTSSTESSRRRRTHRRKRPDSRSGDLSLPARHVPPSVGLPASLQARNPPSRCATRL